MKTSDLIKLVQDTFGQEPGKSLLNELVKTARQPLYDPDPVRMYGKVAIADQINGWDAWVNADESVLKEVLEQESQQDILSQSEDDIV